MCRQHSFITVLDKNLLFISASISERQNLLEAICHITIILKQAYYCTILVNDYFR